MEKLETFLEETTKNSVIAYGKQKKWPVPKNSTRAIKAIKSETMDRDY